MRLYELFDNPEGWTTRSVGETLYHSFIIDDIEYVVRIERDTKFPRLKLDSAYAVVFGIKGQDQYGLDYSITRTGNQYKVFSTVIEIIRSFVSDKSPSVLRFVAEERSRQKLYNRMVRSLSSSLGFEYTIKREGNSLVYFLYKKGEDIEKISRHFTADGNLKDEPVPR